MDEQFLYDFRTGCGNSAKFARIFDMGFSSNNGLDILCVVLFSLFSSDLVTIPTLFFQMGTSKTTLTSKG